MKKGGKESSGIVDGREKLDFLRETFHVVRRIQFMNLRYFLINFWLLGVFFVWKTAQNLDHMETVFNAIRVFN